MAKRKFKLIDELPDSIKSSLGRFISNVGGRTFVITGLPLELTGGVLARYSRSPTGLQLTLVNEFLDENGEPSQEKGTELMDRVLNAYGDDSVGELEGTHVGIEDISQLAIKTIEDKRIGGSPIEQSTRYVRYDIRDSQGRWRYIRPAEIVRLPHVINNYEKVNDLAFEVYSEGVEKLTSHFRLQFPEENFEIELQREGKKVKVKKRELTSDEEDSAFRIAYNFTIRCAALDVGRCILPASALTQFGIYGNGRFYTNVITALKSGELEEEKERGFELENELNKTIPTFIKRNRVDSNVSVRNREMRNIAEELFRGIIPETKWVTLMPQLNYFDAVLASSLFPFTSISLEQISDKISSLSEEEKLFIFSRYIGERKDRRDRSGRGLEAGYPLVFDLVGGFAEYRDLQRHRMLTQQRQLLSVEHGFIMPPEIIEVGLEKRVSQVIDQMHDLNTQIKREDLLVASQYATLFNHRLRFMLGMNLRGFQHLSELRTQPAGHFSYRSMVMEMANQVKARYPFTTNSLEFVNYSDPGNKISRAMEQSRIAGKNLSSGTSNDVDF